MEVEFKISKKEKVIIFLSLIIILIYFLVLPAFPYFLFENKVSQNNITVYYNDEDFEQNSLLTIIDEVATKIERSAFYDKDLKSEIFICNSKSLYVFLNPLNFKGFASNHVRYRNIFIANADPKNNLSSTNFDLKRTEKLTNLLAHEINHGLSKKFNGKTLSGWKEEGYADYIAYDKQVDLITEYADSLNSNYWYMKRKCYVYYLLEVKEVEINEFINSDYDLQELDLEIKAYLKK